MSSSFRILFRAALLGLLFVSAARSAEPVRVVATGGRIGYTFYTFPAGNTVFRQRTAHLLGGPVSEIQVGLMDWMYTGDKAETANTTNDVVVTHAWLERASTGQVLPLTLSGGRQLTLPKDSTAPCWLFDPIPSSAWTVGPAPARDEVFWLNLRGTVPEGGKIPVGTPARYAGAGFVTYPQGNDAALDSAGPMPSIAGGTTRGDALPVVILGRFTGPGHLSVIGIGDSILNGSGDFSGAVITGFGFFNRAALDENGSNAIAMFNLTRHGQTAYSWTLPGRQTRQATFLPFANVVVEEYGTNDLGHNGTGEVNTILARLETIWDAARAAGVQKIVRTLLMPRTASTDDWKTLAAQTPNTGWAAEGKRDQINAGLVAAQAVGKVDLLVDSLAVLADPADDTRWLSNGTSDYTTTDGTHVAPEGNRLMGVALRAALLSLTVDAPGPLTYATWCEGFEWAGADSAPEADADGDGLGNLLAYALDLSPLVPAASASLPAVSVDSLSAEGPWLAFTYRENVRASDLAYTVQSSSDLVAWSTLTSDGADIISEVADADPDDDGGTVGRRVRIRLDATAPRSFLRLLVSR